MKFFIFWILLLFSGLSFSTPFLSSDPYLPSEPQPLTFEFYISGNLVRTIKPSKNSQGQLYLHLDLSRYTFRNKNITIKARNTWGVSDPITVHVYTHSSTPKMLSLSPLILCTFVNSLPTSCF